METPTVEHDLFCPECSYNLRGLGGDRCPECGKPYDAATLAISQIPWAHRAELGWLTAYWRTVWFALFRSRQLFREIVRPVTYGDSQRFRWMTILHVAFPLAAVSAVWTGIESSRRNGVLFGSFALDAAGWLLFQATVILYLVAATGVPSYFFHPRRLSIERQNRSIALSYYACAPLAISTLTILLGFSEAVMFGNTLGNPRVMIVLGGLLAIVQVLLWWRLLLGVSHLGMQANTGRTVLIALAVPALWLALGGVIFVGIPLLVGYLAIMTISLI